MKDEMTEEDLMEEMTKRDEENGLKENDRYEEEKEEEGKLDLDDNYEDMVLDFVAK